jgi:hypothetical protein
MPKRYAQRSSLMSNHIGAIMHPDSLQVIKQASPAAINWIQLGIQTGVLTLVFGFIGELFRRYLQRQLEFLKSEFVIIQTTFSNNYTFVLDYYSVYMTYYRACQKVVRFDVTQYPKQAAERTDHAFLAHLDQNVADLMRFDSKIRLIFPQGVLSLYLETIERFNEFAQIVKSFKTLSKKPKVELNKKFREIDELRLRLEKELKRYLRTEKLFPN